MVDDVGAPAAPAPPDDHADPSDPGPQPGRVSKWDRPRAPLDWRTVVGGIGKVLLATGLLMFGFVAYQLWGTGLETARAQRSLENEFEALLATSPSPPATTASTPSTVSPASTVPATSTSDATAPPTTVAATTTTIAPTTTTTIAPPPTLPPVQPGDPIARLEIPAIGVDDYVVAGVSVEDLRKGPGHFPDTPLPGQLGNAAIAGHRTTYGQPFRDVDDLVPGDEIVVTTVAGRFVYRVTGTTIVDPSAYEVVATTDPDVANLTLTSCHPVWSAAQRIVVSSELDAAASDPVSAPTSYVSAASDDGASTATVPPIEPTPTTAPAGAVTTLSTAAPASTPAVAPDDGEDTSADAFADSSQDAFARGWFHDSAAWAQVALWGLVVTTIAVGAWLLSRRTRHDSIGVAAGVVPFAIALYFFFQNVNRLLPPGL